MDLRQLAALVAISDQGSFSGAAASLHTVQSNVSGLIKRLERELGAELVDRQTGQLTDEGRVVEARARAVQADLSAIVADLAALRHQVVGSVRLGMIATTARWLVPLLLDRLATTHPGIRLVTTEATSTPLSVMLTSGVLDSAVVNLPLANPELRVRPLFDEDIVLVIARDHPLAAAEVVDLSQLRGMELLMSPPHTSFREELDQAARAAGITLRSKADIDGLRLLAALVLRGYGPALLPATALSDVPGLYKAVAVNGLPLRHVGVAQRKRSRTSAPTKALLDVLEAVTAQFITTNEHLHEPS